MVLSTVRNGAVLVVTLTSRCSTVRASPIFAPGHWWLVNTANSHVKIQATYGGVGVARNGGWQAWGKTKKFHGIPPTSVTSLAFTGKFMKDSVLVVQTPCDWDYDEQKCLTTD